jgi:hypothetical protein
VPIGDCVLSMGLKLTNRQLSKIISLYQRELLKKIPGLGTFCTVSRRVLKYNCKKFHCCDLQIKCFISFYYIPSICYTLVVDATGYSGWLREVRVGKYILQTAFGELLNYHVALDVTKI